MSHLIDKYFPKLQEVIIQNVSAVKDVFIDHYGENRVDCVFLENRYSHFQDEKLYAAILHYADQSLLPDLKGYTLESFYTIEDPGIINRFSKALSKYLLEECFYNIIVHFPEVTVTNEMDDSVDIQDLFIKITIRGNGNYFSIAGKRSTFTKNQYDARYIHSHIYPLDKWNPHVWHNLCFGNGPISNTTEKLKSSLDENNLIEWKMFCIELDLWTQVESLVGVPYVRMCKILSRRLDKYCLYDSILMDNDIKAFISYVMKSNSIPFGFSESNYFIAMDDMDFVFHITSLYNKMLEETEAHPMDNAYCDCIIDKDQLWCLSNDRIDVSIKDGMKILDFKGQPVYLKFVESTDNAATFKILKPCIVQAIAGVITMTVNQLYTENEK